MLVASRAATATFAVPMAVVVLTRSTELGTRTPATTSPATATTPAAQAVARSDRALTEVPMARLCHRRRPGIHHRSRGQLQSPYTRTCSFTVDVRFQSWRASSTQKLTQPWLWPSKGFIISREPCRAWPPEKNCE